jgi:glycosyltransferase involved in cell wall biosynthesis
MTEVLPITLQGSPLISIIVRTKDRPMLLKRALQSLAAQSYRPIEVVLVNDGGCDIDVGEIKGILGDISLVYTRLERNMGRAQAGNAGIGNATGQFIGFLDDDDVYLPGGVGTLVNAVLNNNGSVIYGKVLCRKYADDIGFTEIGEKVIGEPFDPGRLILENFIPINAVCIPKHFIDKLGPLDTQFVIYEDWDMMIRLSEMGSFHHIDAVVAEYSIIGAATISGKGGAATQNSFREKILSKHIGKVKARDLVSYVQSIIDRVVLEKDARVHELLYALDEKRTSIRALEGSVASMEEMVRNLEGAIRSKDERIGLIEDSVKAKDGLIGGLEEAVRAKHSLICHLENVVNELSAALKTKEVELAGAAQRESELKRLIADITSSDSWKLTRPLRAVGTVVKKLTSR